MGRALIAALFLLGPVLAAADALENAYFVCDVFAKTGVSTDCNVSNITSTIDVVVDTTAADAANICDVIAQRMVEKKRGFGGGWKLQVFAPDKANEPLAACPLR